MSSCFAAVAPHRSRFLLLAIGLISLGVVVLAVQTSTQVRAQGPVGVSAGNVSELIAEINAANGRTEPTIITLTSSEYVLTAPDNGDNGLPVVTGDITIEGNGHTIRRDSSSPFRILYVTGTLTLNQVTISGVDSGNLDGNGIYNDAGVVTLTDTTISGNLSSSGGALETYGGGIYSESGDLTLTNSTISGNEASFGGGIYNIGGDLTLTNSTISGNRLGGTQLSTAGGGIYKYSGNVTLTNSTVSGNEADSGGGIYSQFGTVTLTNSTVIGNEANSGGGIDNFLGAVTLTNSIVWGNQGDDIAEDSPTETININHAIIGSGCPGSASNCSTDGPLFVDAEPASSAPTTEGDYRLQSNSPAIDAGSVSLYESTFDGDVVETDLDGNSRLSGANIDLGAYEFQQDPNIDRIYVDASNTDVLQSGVSWDRAFSDLQDGLALAEASLASAAVDNVDIFVAGGAYYPAPEGSQDRNATFAIPDGVSLYGGFAGDESTPLDVLDQRNLETNKTVLSGDIGTVNDADDNVYTVVTVTQNNAATIDGVTIAGANANGGELGVDPSTHGGGIYIDGGDLTLANSTVSDNSAGQGGSILMDHGDATLINSTVSGNSAGGGGGSVSNWFGNLTLINSTVSGNSADSGSGGGIENLYADVTLINSTVSGNSADSGSGGGIYLLNTGSPTDLTLTNSTVSGNSAGQGGGIYIDGDVDLTLTNSIIWGNDSDDIAGGIGSGLISHGIIGVTSTQVTCNASNDCSDADPLFIDPLSPTLAPTSDGDYRLLPGSPAIDAGDNSAIAGYDEDLDGNTRIVDGTVDLGAYEAQFTDVALEISADPNPAPLGSTVNVTVAVTGANLDTLILDGVDVDYSGPDGDETLTLDSQGEATTAFTGDSAGDVALEADLGTLSDSLTVTVASLPTLSLPPDRTLTYMQRNNVNWDATATDWAGNDIDVTCDPESGSDFSVGTTTVTCEATDSLGQTATGSFTVTVQPEPEPDAPQIRNVPDTIVAFPVSPAGVPVDYPMPHAVDPTDGDIPVTCDPPPGSWFGVGHNTVTCSATNSLEMTTTVTFGISVAPFDSADVGHLDDIANAWFWAVWARTDLPVRDGHALRSWMWGQGPFTESIWEPYTTDLQNPGGDPVFLEIPESEREVIYFDKARMEINDPDADPDDPWSVTNGLLVIEMITGQRQFGDDLFIEYEPSQGNVAGDADDINGPTYASLQNVLDEPAQPVGTLLTQEIDRDGTVTTNEQWGSYGIEVGHVDDVTEHGIAGPFWEFMNSEGTVYGDGDLFTDDLFQNAYYATGRPVTEPYWANVQVGGEMRDVLIQCFERRCLTYTPGNSEGFVVEAGNVGQHYYQWRNVQAPDE